MSTVAGFALGSPEFAESVGASLDRVEGVIRAEVESGIEAMAAVAEHLVKAGGKRFRPLFAVVAGKLGREEQQGDVEIAAAALELIHLATLYHDDVMDEATMRRGVTSANVQWGNQVAILAGDYLFARACGLIARLGSEATAVVAQTFGELVTGQLRDVVGAGSDQGNAAKIEHYLATIHGKTASLIGACGRLAGLAIRADQDIQDRLASIGELTGMAFQIADDIIDIGSGSADSGKTPGTDLREGVLTLPTLYALEEEGGGRLKELVGSGPITDDALVAEALALLTASPAMARARTAVEDYARRAEEEIAALPEAGPQTEEVREAMRAVVRAAVDRVR
ncbi:MAG: polyprenyl synthetase family protein [Segniliparus sp.]|uniref:polyprenyl synthetase family protein n=1 Tax=Segniliparus sp. TaxID=2804064 RepID=UPI003F3DE383